MAKFTCCYDGICKKPIYGGMLEIETTLCKKHLIMDIESNLDEYGNEFVEILAKLKQ